MSVFLFFCLCVLANRQRVRQMCVNSVNTRARSLPLRPPPPLLPISPSLSPPTSFHAFIGSLSQRLRYSSPLSLDIFSPHLGTHQKPEGNSAVVHMEVSPPRVHPLSALLSCTNSLKIEIFFFLFFRYFLHIARGGPKWRFLRSPSCV